MKISMQKHTYTHMPCLTLQASSGTKPLTPPNKAQEFMARAFQDTASKQVQEEGELEVGTLLLSNMPDKCSLQSSVMSQSGAQSESKS